MYGLYQSISGDGVANKLTANFSKASKYMLTPGLQNTSADVDLNLKMGNITLEKVRSIKYLGVIFDERFSWGNHVSYLCTKLSKSVGVLSKLRYYVNIDTLLKTYYSLVNSHLSYSLMSWGTAGTTVLQPIRVLQNRAIRFLSNASRYTRLDYAYLNLRVLKLDDLYKLIVAKFMHHYYLGNLPNHFDDLFVRANSIHQYRLRSASSSNYRAMRCMKTNTQRSICYIGPKTWNEILETFRSTNKYQFKKSFTNFCLANY